LVDQGLRWFDLESGDVGGAGVEGEEVAGSRQPRACIRLKPEAAAVWSRLDKVARIQFGAMLNQLVVWYGRTGSVPAAPVDVILSGSEMITKWYMACREQVSVLEGEVGRLRGELERLKQGAASRVACEQRAEALQRQLEEERARSAQLQQQLGQLRRGLELEKARVQRLAQILCPHLEKLKQLARNPREEVELEALCWPKEGAGVKF
jgi:DNA repair exonuclease SbcCD ATPase subunit